MDLEPIRAWWLRNDVTDWVRTIAITIVLVTIIYYFLWGVQAALSWGVNVTGLTWVLRSAVFISFGITVHMIWTEYQRYKEDPVNYPYGPPQAEDKDEHSVL